MRVGRVRCLSAEHDLINRKNPSTSQKCRVQVCLGSRRALWIFPWSNQTEGFSQNTHTQENSFRKQSSNMHRRTIERLSHYEQATATVTGPIAYTILHSCILVATFPASTTIRSSSNHRKTTNKMDGVVCGRAQQRSYLDQIGPEKRYHRSCRAGSWSLDSYSTITTADETRDFSEQQELSVHSSASVVWEGNTPVEVSVPSCPFLNDPSSRLPQSFLDLPTKENNAYSTPIDLDLMDDYYKYESIQNTTEYPYPTPKFEIEKNQMNDERPRPLVRNKICRNSSGGLEGLAHLPERCTRFEV